MTALCVMLSLGSIILRVETVRRDLWLQEVVARMLGLMWQRQQAEAVAPDVGMAVVVCGLFSLCSLGCRWLSRAASWLECERRYVGMAVPEGGVGGPLGVAE